MHAFCPWFPRWCLLSAFTSHLFQHFAVWGDKQHILYRDGTAEMVRSRWNIQPHSCKKAATVVVTWIKESQHCPLGVECISSGGSKIKRGLREGRDVIPAGEDSRVPAGATPALLPWTIWLMLINVLVLKSLQTTIIANMTCKKKKSHQNKKLINWIRIASPLRGEKKGVGVLVCAEIKTRQSDSQLPPALALYSEGTVPYTNLVKMNRVSSALLIGSRQQSPSKRATSPSTTLGSPSCLSIAPSLSPPRMRRGSLCLAIANLALSGVGGGGQGHKGGLLGKKRWGDSGDWRL